MRGSQTKMKSRMVVGASNTDALMLPLENRPHAKIRALLSKDEEHLIESIGLDGLAIDWRHADIRTPQET